jgi:RNA polymerase sigma-70 factor, ECF subfamily
MMSLPTPGSAVRRLAPAEAATCVTPASGDSLPQSGEQRLRSLMSAHHPMVWRTLRNLGVSPADLDDAVQQVFIVASQKLEAICVGCERSFLAGVAVRIASRARRTRERRREVDEIDPANHPATAGGPAEELDRAEARHLFEMLLDSMPADLRLALVMYEVEELTLAEIASALDAPLGTVASRVRRARELFVTKARRIAGRGKLDGGRQ